MKGSKVKNIITVLSDVLEKDPKLSVARIRLLLMIKNYDNKGTTSQISSDLGVSKKYVRKFIAEAERAGYVEKERFSDDPSTGDCIRYKLTSDSENLLKTLLGV